MYGATHAAFGAYLGTLTPNPALAFVLGLSSHAVLDAIPHHDYRTTGWGAVDAAVAVAILVLVGGRGTGISPLAGSIGGLLPDLEVVLLHLGLTRRKPVFPSHSGLLPHPPLPFRSGFWHQILLGVVSLLPFCL